MGLPVGLSHPAVAATDDPPVVATGRPRRRAGRGRRAEPSKEMNWRQQPSAAPRPPVGSRSPSRVWSEGSLCPPEARYRSPAATEQEFVGRAEPRRDPVRMPDRRLGNVDDGRGKCRLFSVVGRAPARDASAAQDGRLARPRGRPAQSSHVRSLPCQMGASHPETGSAPPETGQAIVRTWIRGNPVMPPSRQGSRRRLNWEEARVRIESRDGLGSPGANAAVGGREPTPAPEPGEASDGAGDAR